jgi:hypothetical protein
MASWKRTRNLQFIALETLENSTKLLEFASVLLKRGKVVEAERLRNEARLKRNNSVRLLEEASEAALRDRNQLSEPAF